MEMPDQEGWHFGMKAHIGVDAGTPQHGPRRAHEASPPAGADAGYQGVHKREENLRHGGCRCVRGAAGLEPRRSEKAQ